MKKLWRKIQSWDMGKKRIFVFSVLGILALPFLIFIWSNFRRNFQRFNSMVVLKKFEMPPPDESDKKSLEEIMAGKSQLEKELERLGQEENLSVSSGTETLFGPEIATSTLPANSQATGVQATSAGE
jgi:hypothetical protein